MSWSLWLPESSESDEQEWPLRSCEINNKWQKKRGRELKIKSSYTVNPSRSSEDHFTFQHLLHFVAGKNLFTEHLTNAGFLPLATRLPAPWKRNGWFSMRVELGGEFAHLDWEPYDAEERGCPLTSTRGNTTGSEEVVASNSCGIKKWKDIHGISFLEGKRGLFNEK